MTPPGGCLQTVCHLCMKIQNPNPECGIRMTPPGGCLNSDHQNPESKSGMRNPDDPSWGLSADCVPSLHENPESKSGMQNSDDPFWGLSELRPPESGIQIQNSESECFLLGAVCRGFLAVNESFKFKMRIQNPAYSSAIQTCKVSSLR